MDPVLVWLVMAAVLLGIAAIAPIAESGGGIHGVHISLLPLGLMCWVIGEITARS